MYQRFFRFMLCVICMWRKTRAFDEIGATKLVASPRVIQPQMIVLPLLGCVVIRTKDVNPLSRESETEV